MNLRKRNWCTFFYRIGFHNSDFNAKSESIKQTDENVCPKCGYDWEAHEFAVPAPYCPSNDEDAEVNRKTTISWLKRLKEIREKL